MICLLENLGSTAYTINGTTAPNRHPGETRYFPWGKDRFTSGQTLTSYKFTGQREEAGLGLYYYGARWYNPALGRFVQPDTIVPNPRDVQAFDRYAYVFNNPLKYTDPSGHTGVAIHDSNDGPPVAMSYNTMADIQEDYYNLGVSWTNLPHDVRTAFESQGATGYMDFHGNATSQNGTIRDPAVIGASLYGVGRLIWRLPLVLTGACADDGCEREYRTLESTVARFDPVKASEQGRALLKQGISIGDHALREAQKENITTQQIADTFTGAARNTQYYWDGGRVAQWSPHTNVAVIIEKGTREVVTVFKRTSPQISWEAMSAFDIMKWLQK